MVELPLPFQGVWELELGKGLPRGVPGGGFCSRGGGCMEMGNLLGHWSQMKSGGRLGWDFKAEEESQKTEPLWAWGWSLEPGVSSKG